MHDPYKIVVVQPEWMFRSESLGSKKKFWYRQAGETGRNWLFKYPQPNTGQHWAEKIAEEIARRLGVKHARVELAVVDDRRGSVTESFVSPALDLWHGNQVLTGADHGYDSEARFHHSSHTLERIWGALERVFKRAEAAKRAKLRIASGLPVHWLWYGTLHVPIQIFFSRRSAGSTNWTSGLFEPSSTACQRIG